MNTFSRSLWWAVRPLWVWRLIRLLVRSLWLASLLALAGWLFTLRSGSASSWVDWAVIGAVLSLSLFCLFALWPIPARRLARRLDHNLDLMDQLTAAYEVAERGPQNYVETDLLEAAQFTLGEARRRYLFRLQIPWTDLEMALLVGTAIVAAYYWIAASAVPPPPAIQPAQFEALPPIAAEPIVDLPGVPAALKQGLPGQVASGSEGSPPGSVADAAAGQDILDALAEALSAQSITQAAAAALSQGDVERAADELRELAQAAGSISQEARVALADSLGEAAERLEDTAPEAAEELAAISEEMGQNIPNQLETNALTADSLEGVAQMIEAADGLRAQTSDGTNGAGDQSGEGANAEQEGEAGPGDGASEAEPVNTEDGQGNRPGGGSAGHSGSSEEESTGSVESLRSLGVSVPLPRTESLDPGSLRPPDRPGMAYQRRSVPYAHFGASGAGGEQTSDPLTIPWRLRNVIQRYFSPP